MGWCVPVRDSPRPASTSPAYPGPGRRARKDTTQTGPKHVQHEDGLASRHPHHQRHRADQPLQPHIARSLRPRTAVPPTLLIADMGDGSVLLQGWREGPSAYLCPADAAPLKRELAAAFGSTELTPCTDEGEAL